jgi:hypothetical protein
MLEGPYTLEARYQGEGLAIPLARTSSLESASLIAAGLIGREDDDPVQVKVYGPEWEIVLEYERGGLSHP